MTRRRTVGGARCALPIYWNNRAVFDCVYRGGVPSCPPADGGPWEACAPLVGARRPHTLVSVSTCKPLTTAASAAAAGADAPPTLTTPPRTPSPRRRRRQRDGRTNAQTA